MILANEKGNERNDKGGVHLNVKTNRGIRQKWMSYKSDDEVTQHYMQKMGARRSQHKHFKPNHRADGHKYRLAACCISEDIILSLISDKIKRRRLKTGEIWKISTYNDVIHCYLEVCWGPYLFPNPVMLRTSCRIYAIL